MLVLVRHGRSRKILRCKRRAAGRHLLPSAMRIRELRCAHHCPCMADRVGKPPRLGSHPATRSRADGDKRIAISKPGPHFAAWQVQYEYLYRCYSAPAPAAHSAVGKEKAT